MRAFRLHETGEIDTKPLQLENLRVPKPGPGQILLQIKTCGICHTDLHTVEGDLTLPLLPVTPGHQIVGIVHAIGDNATRFRPGDRVGVAWLGQACGECQYCQQGLENLCPAARFTGLHIDGGYADFTLVDLSLYQWFIRSSRYKSI